MTKVRLDQLLVQRGLLESRAQARAAIEAGGVTVEGEPARQPSQKVSQDAILTAEAAHRFVSRAALKLDHALSLWPITVVGRTVLDLGASTGGFTEVCLERGAARVFAVDVGRDQLHARIAADTRVVNLQGTDARDLTSEMIDVVPALVVCDASFIGLAKLLPVPLSLAEPGADLLCLVKPQFEMDSRADIGRGGIVRDADARQAALGRVADWLSAQGWSVQATTESPILGGDGNLEFLLWSVRRDV